METNTVNHGSFSSPLYLFTLLMSFFSRSSRFSSFYSYFSFFQLFNDNPFPPFTHFSFSSLPFSFLFYLTILTLSLLSLLFLVFFNTNYNPYPHFTLIYRFVTCYLQQFSSFASYFSFFLINLLFLTPSFFLSDFIHPFSYHWYSSSSSHHGPSFPSLLSAVETHQWTHRQQGVVVDGLRSEQAPVTSGVPQGPILGALVFVIYIYDAGVGISNLIFKF